MELMGFTVNGMFWPLQQHCLWRLWAQFLFALHPVLSEVTFFSYLYVQPWEHVYSFKFALMLLVAPHPKASILSPHCLYAILLPGHY